MRSRRIFGSSRATLNLTRQAMRAYGWAPSTRLFEAAASGACIISDTWPGLDELFEPDVEVLLADNRQDVLRHLDQLSPVRQTRIGAAARDRVLREHTYGCRAEQVETAIRRCLAVSTVQKGKACASAS
jgi:spore maturation protein CgeB